MTQANGLVSWYEEAYEARLVGASRVLGCDYLYQGRPSSLTCPRATPHSFQEPANAALLRLGMDADDHESQLDRNHGVTAAFCDHFGDCSMCPGESTAGEIGYPDVASDTKVTCTHWCHSGVLGT